MKDPVPRTEWFGISSLFSGILGVLQSDAEPNDNVVAPESAAEIMETENVKENDIPKEESKGSMLLEEFGEEHPNKAAGEDRFDVPSVGGSHLNLILEQKKTQALEQQRQGKECINCVDDGEGNLLPADLVQAIRMQKMKVQMEEAQQSNTKSEAGRSGKSAD